MLLIRAACRTVYCSKQTFRANHAPTRLLPGDRVRTGSDVRPEPATEVVLVLETAQAEPQACCFSLRPPGARKPWAVPVPTWQAGHEMFSLCLPPGLDDGVELWLRPETHMVPSRTARRVAVLRPQQRLRVLYNAKSDFSLTSRQERHYLYIDIVFDVTVVAHGPVVIPRGEREVLLDDLKVVDLRMTLR